MNCLKSIEKCTRQDSFKMKYLLYITLILPLLSFSQIDKLDEANEKFENFAYVDARQIYLEVAEAGYESESLFKKLGDSYYFNNDLENAEKWYGKLFDYSDDLSTDYLFRYAQSLRGVEKYEESVKYMKKFDSITKRSVETAELDDKQNYLELIDLQSGKFKIDTIASINSELSDFAPKFGNGKLIFASNRERSDVAQRIHEWNNQPFLDIYEVEVDEQFSIVGQPKPMSDKINSKFHDASATITKDGKTIYFTRNNFTDKEFKKSESGVNFLKIYRSEKDAEGNWQDPVELPFNSDDYSCAHPVLDPAEDKLYFASNMPGTKGKSDIFKVEIRSNGEFGEPVNLGSTINTSGRESFPFVNEDGLLFFSSNGHPGLGGYDVFVSEIELLNEPMNLGRPINSPKDDISFIVDASTKIGFFATNRDKDAKEDDIYKFIQTEDLITKCKQYLSGVVKEEDTGDALTSATVKLFSENLELIEKTKTDVNGEYSFNVDCNKRYIIRIEKDGYQTQENLIKSSSQYEKEVDNDASLRSGENLGVQKAEKGDDLRDILQLDPIYFELDRSRITDQAQVELQKVAALMKQYSSMKIDIRSHTDSRAGDAYNKILSQKRAEATMSYIIEQGISKRRVSGKGYGETQLVNNCSNGVECTEQQHAKNRRSEFIILNENETPQELRKKLDDQVDVADSSTNKNINDKPVQNKVSKKDASKTYDFKPDSPKIFTVQVSASAQNREINIPNVDNEYNYSFDDGYKRYFSGVFSSKAQADKHKERLLKKGVKGAFVVALKGNKRIILSN